MQLKELSGSGKGHVSNLQFFVFLNDFFKASHKHVSEFPALPQPAHGLVV